MKELKKLVDSLGAKAQMVAAINLGDMIDDVDLLAVALSMSNLTEVARTLSAAEEAEMSYIAAHKALDIGWNPSIRETLIEAEYFAKGLCGLLELAETNPVAGSRLMPVFEEAVSIHKELGITKELKCNLKNFMERKLEFEGFAISHRDEEGKVMVRTAEWVNKMAEKALAQIDEEF